MPKMQVCEVILNRVDGRMPQRLAVTSKTDGKEMASRLALLMRAAHVHGSVEVVPVAGRPAEIEAGTSRYVS